MLKVKWEGTEKGTCKAVVHFTSSDNQATKWKKKSYRVFGIMKYWVLLPNATFLKEP